MSVDIYFVTRLISVLLLLISIGLAVKAKCQATMEPWMYWLIIATGMLIPVQWTQGLTFWVFVVLYVISCYGFGFTLAEARGKQRGVHRKQRRTSMERKNHADY